MSRSNRKQGSAKVHWQRAEYARLQRALDKRGGQALQRPLVHWALPSDRGLPLAFLDLPLAELLAESFDSLRATQGVGERKISVLLDLLRRAQQSCDDRQAEQAGPSVGENSADPDQPIDPARVSEDSWARWCETVARHDVGPIPLGRLAPTLRRLPTVLWSTPLEQYAGHTLGEIRRMRTHGEKRVTAIVEAFHQVHQTLAGTRAASHVAMRLTPRFVLPLESWLARTLTMAAIPTTAEIREQLALPMVGQLQTDVGSTTAKLAAGRIGLDGKPSTVRRQAQDLQITRARIYQLYETCAEAMQVRWPEGRWLLQALENRLAAIDGAGPQAEMVTALRELFYPHPDAQASEGTTDRSTRRATTSPQNAYSGESAAHEHLEPAGSPA